jgi:hypothetical protein
MKLTKITFFFVTVFSAANSIAQSSKIDVQKGQKYKVETTSKIYSEANVMGQAMVTSTDNTTHNLYEITGSGQDGISLTSTITRLTAYVSAMGQEMNFDSDKKDNEGPLTEELSKMVNNPKNIILDNNGTITKQDEQTSANSMINMNGGNIAPETELFIPALIGKELIAGNSFLHTGSFTKDKANSRDTGTYTITSVENGVASILYKGTQISTMVMEQMGTEITTNSNNTITKELQMDIKTGMVITNITTVKMIISLDAAGMTIPATGNTLTNIKITPLQ